MAKTIIDLPSELVELIATRLNDEDVLALRRTSRPLERGSFSHFGKRFFRKKGYLLTSPSLAVLQGVADHSQLRKYVQHVWFNPDCFTFIRPECAPDPEETPDPENPDGLVDLLSPNDRRMYQAYEECMKDHYRLIAHTASELQSVLTKAFAKLPNLKIIGMRRSEDHRPWGWRTLRDAVGEDPRVLGPIPSGPLYMLSTPARLFLALLSAVADSGVVLRRFYTDAIELDNIRPDLLSQELLNEACSSIWYLEVNVMRSLLNTKRNANYITPGHPKWVDGDGLLRLLRGCHSLKEIGLQIFPDRQATHRLAALNATDRFAETWQFKCFDNVMLKVDMPGLDRIKLEKLVTTPYHLLAFLRPSATCLTSLKLRDVRLIGGEDASPWQSIFQFLHDECPRLDSILLHHLLYTYGGVSFAENIESAALAAEDGTETEGGNGEAWNDRSSHFTDYEKITLQISGAENVRRSLGDVVEGHWYQKPLFTYEMDDMLWHTDTSDEEW
ncbi:hypothetical protein B0A50_03276 [Salinomyces thailandicus]|uniref:F-box domain-containing protein n=1 Tax=Salinomyces thailandicus TaxID=706561 RepID=A0A4U0U410_9PEZI|nr:hypothetical protein B0A50_03276 [Salinomyces thailandica]